MAIESGQKFVWAAVFAEAREVRAATSAEQAAADLRLPPDYDDEPFDCVEQRGYLSGVDLGGDPRIDGYIKGDWHEHRKGSGRFGQVRSGLFWRCDSDD